VQFHDKDYGSSPGRQGSYPDYVAPTGTTDDVDFGSIVSVVDPQTGDATQDSKATLTERRSSSTVRRMIS